MNDDDSFLIARWHVNDAALPTIESFDYFINNSYGTVPLGHWLQINMTESPVTINTTANWYQVDGSQIHQVQNHQITLDEPQDSMHRLNVWRGDLRILDKSGIIFVLGKDLTNHLYHIEGVSTDWYPYPDGNTQVQITYEPANWAFYDVKENDLVGMNGSVDYNIASQDYKKVYKAFPFNRITLTEGEQAKLYGDDLINDSLPLSANGNSRLKIFTSSISLHPPVQFSTTLIDNCSVGNITANGVPIPFTCNGGSLTTDIPAVTNGLRLDIAYSGECIADWECTGWSEGSCGSRECMCACGTDCSGDGSESLSCGGGGGGGGSPSAPEPAPSQPETPGTIESPTPIEPAEPEVVFEPIIKEEDRPTEVFGVQVAKEEARPTSQKMTGMTVAGTPKSPLGWFFAAQFITLMALGTGMKVAHHHVTRPDVSKQLRGYIAKMRAKGSTDDHIKEILKQAGWKESVIRQYL
ncbi:MAG: hypothetical protein V1735_07565 [Nanoarchaeota archaeon]